MRRDVQKKIEFITYWFNEEKVRLSFSDQKTLLDSWIKVLVESEEYEMASALKNEKKKVIQDKLNARRKSRTILQILKYRLIKLKRKIRDSRNK